MNRIRPLLEWVSTVLVGVAAASLLWTLWFSAPTGPAAREPKPVKGMRISSENLRNTKGSGKVALIEFADFQCSFCATHATQTFPQIDKEFLQTGLVKYAYMHYPLEPIHPLARKAGEAAECAGRHGKYWEMHHRLFQNPSALGNDDLVRHAESLGMEPATFSKCLAGEMEARVTADIAEGGRLGIEGTPAFFIGTFNSDGSVTINDRINGAVSLSRFREAIQAAQDSVR